MGWLGNLLFVCRTLNCAATKLLGWLAVRSARLLLRTPGAQQKALLLFFLLGVAGSAQAATPANFHIANTATASYRIGANTFTASAVAADDVTASCMNVGVKLDLMKYVPTSRLLSATARKVNFAFMPPYYSPTGSDVGPFVQGPTSVSLRDDNFQPFQPSVGQMLWIDPVNDESGKPLASFSRNDPIFIRAISYGANKDGAVAEQVAVVISTANGADKEIVQLFETGASTGVFVGVITTDTASAASHYDGQLTIGGINETVTASYTYSDPSCPANSNVTSSSSSLIDPLGIVFDSSTGQPVDGATVTLINVETGLPAQVFCDDGTTPLTQPITTGAPICGIPTVAGGYRFPRVAPGNYRLQVTPPSGFVFPSTVPPNNLPASIGTVTRPPIILGNPGVTPGASYGGAFTLWDTVLHVDIPVDVGGTTISIQITADKSVVGTGEFISYSLNIKNNTDSQLPIVQIADYLPPGFRYQKGSSKQDGVPIADPVLSADGRVMTFSIEIPPSGSIVVRYVLEVTPAARTGLAENRAAAISGATSNTGRAQVMVREDLFRNKSILIGRVIDVSKAENQEFVTADAARSVCDERADNDFKGLQNARIVLQDGTYVLTDSEGRWHIDNLRSGTHVVQLDLDSLPKDYEVVSCEDNSRFAGRMYSQFVNLRGGSVWRADFHVRKKPRSAPRLSQTLSARAEEESTLINLSLEGSAELAGYSATFLLPEEAQYVVGSAKLNGKPSADPVVKGNTLTFHATARAAKWQDRYEFRVQHVAPRALFHAYVRFTPPGHATQTAPTMRILMLNHAPVSTSSEVIVPVQADDIRPAKTPGDDHPMQLVEKLPYDEAWLASAAVGNEWLHPQESFSPNLPVIKAAVKHHPKHKVLLKINGEAVDSLAYDGAKVNAARTVALSIWRGIPLREGDNQLEMSIVDDAGNTVMHEVRTIHYATIPDRVELLPLQSRLVADGKTRPMIAVRFLDKDGKPVRRGINGEFDLNEPYRAWDRREGIEREPLAGRIAGKARYEVKTGGIAMIELEPTTQTGEVILNFQFNDGRKQELRVWLEPGHRDWILVGFAEGTLGHKILSGNMQALQATGVDDQLFDGNKLAFYAKGTIKGEYLLTAAYDTAKQLGKPLLKQAIDPTQYYTLYSDATQAQHDAASSSRLYVKLERKQFYAMFGDYDTGLTVTELSRYSRTLNGIKSEFKGDKVGYNAFATVTSQAYVKDEIQGNGTSGVYKLSRGNLMINSDKVRIETRDRFQSQNIVSVKHLTRYLDYDIDYYLGTLTFREPIQSRDFNFNPTYIVVEYESADPQDSKATYGGRGSFKPSQNLEFGATVVHEGTVGASGNLAGLDATYLLDEKTKMRVELAGTERNHVGNISRGKAWLGEISHHEEKWDGKIFLREQSSGFGFGQQALSELATRKVGIDGRLKLRDNLHLKGQVYKQENLTTGASNFVAEGRADDKISESLSVYYGARITRDTSASGRARSDQALAGVAYTTLNNKLTLRAAGELSLGKAESVMMPNRLILGSDYKLTEQTKAFVEQEFARGEKIDANMTRLGLRTQPWQGAEMSASVANNFNNDAERLYANLGMVQNWQINEHWQTNFSIDRSQTIRNTASPILNSPLPSGTLPPAVGFSGDYTAIALGGGYNDTLWSANGRLELRKASLGNQQNLQMGVQRNLDAGRSVALGYVLRRADGPAFETRNSDLRLSLAYRPDDSEWVWFNRADYIRQYSNAGGVPLTSEKLVNNFNANWMPNRRTQIAFQYGAKYVLETIDNSEYSGYTDLIGGELRRDLNQNWDVGAFASIMRSWNAGVKSYGLGLSVGYKLMNNIWISVGYNLRGMNDQDFANATYRAKGPFITVRAKFDQDTFGLNGSGERDRPLSGE